MNKKIDSLTGARFFAILVIVVSHFWFLEQYRYGDLYDLYFKNPIMGVDFFFMLSGFGLMLSYLRNTHNNSSSLTIKNILTYACRHIQKIYPLYIITTLIGMPIYIYSDIYKYGGSIVHALVGTISKFCLYLTMLQSATGWSRFNLAFNDPSWFLSTLFCIYIISPFLLLFIKNRINTKKKAILIILISILCSYKLEALFTNIESVSHFDNLHYSSPYIRVFYVICGMAVGRFYCLSKRELPSWVEYTAITLSIIWFFMRNTFSKTLGFNMIIIDMILCSLDLYVIAIQKGSISKFLACKQMVYLGNLSMYIFLVHWLIIRYINIVVNYCHLKTPVIALVEIILVCGSSLLLSAWLYKGSQKKCIAK